MAGYIQEMRKYLGHRPILICGASIIVENEIGEILLQKRKDDGKWSYAGGATELYESVEDAARRELFEETGVRAGAIELLGIFSGPHMNHVYPNGDEASIIEIVYVCRDYTGEPVVDEDEVTQLGFFPVDAIPTPVSSCMNYVIPAYLEMRSKRQ